MSRLSEEEITTSVDAWGGGSAEKSAAQGHGKGEVEMGTGDIIKKEATLRDVVQLQGSLRGLLTQMDTLTTANEKLRSEGELLQMYIENLTKTAITSANGGRR